MERKGIETNIGNLNRDIKSANSLMAAIRKTIKSLLEWIADVSEATKEALAEMKEQNASPTLAGLLNEYLNVRKEERRDWSRYGQNKSSLADVQAVSKAVAYLRDHNLYTLKDLDEALQEVNGRAASIRSAIKTAETRMKTITQIQKAVSVCKEHKAVKDKYLKIGWKAAQAVYAETHKDALSAFDKSFRYLKKQGLDLRVDLTALQSEFDTLEKSVAENNAKLSEVKAELQPLKDVRYWISKVIEPEQGEVEKKPEPKHSVTEKMKYLQEQKKQLEPKSPQHKQKKQNMELTGDFYTVGEVLGHTLAGIGVSLGLSMNFEAVTARYVDVRLERKKEVLDAYHGAVKQADPAKAEKAEPKKAKSAAKKKSSDLEL